MVLCCTLLIAGAQALIKTGVQGSPENATLLQTAWSILVTPRLFAGYSIYGLVTVVMVLALRHAELSIIYPVIALSYVWVSILSVLVFHEHMNVFKISGVLVIVTGVAVLGKGQRG
jgi:multidrug transporter EmrE-like cation transporter